MTLFAAEGDESFRGTEYENANYVFDDDYDIVGHADDFQFVTLAADERDFARFVSSLIPTSILVIIDIIFIQPPQLLPNSFEYDAYDHAYYRTIASMPVAVCVCVVCSTLLDTTVLYFSFLDSRQLHRQLIELYH
jgi:hypothetical protein